MVERAWVLVDWVAVGRGGLGGWRLTYRGQEWLQSYGHIGKT